MIIKNFNIDDIEQIISGGAIGADALAKRFAEENSIALIEHIPQWAIYGKSAGYIRNKLIINDADYVIAFWNGESKGTKISIDLAKKMKKKVIIHRTN